jgi:hypothetical protein
MRFHFPSFLVGFSVALVLLGALSSVLIFDYRNEKFEYARQLGALDAYRTLMRKLSTILGDDYDVHSDGKQILFSGKCMDAMIVERNGVKTLRVYNWGP